MSLDGMQATCNAFYKYCKTHRIRLERKNFTMSYETTIPRQLGLAGSSAIVCAGRSVCFAALVDVEIYKHPPGLSCLLQYYGVKTAVPVAHRPGILLEAEKELGITAGLQDRVVQVCECNILSSIFLHLGCNETKFLLVYAINHVSKKTKAPQFK